MTVAFGSMLFSAIPVIQQLGAILVLACLIDTFIIRSLLVPSLMLVAVDNNWYPKKMPEVTVTMDTLREATAQMSLQQGDEEQQDLDEFSSQEDDIIIHQISRDGSWAD